MQDVDNEVPEALRQAIGGLRTKARLKLIDELHRDMVTQGTDGLRYRYGSLFEYRRIKTERPWEFPVMDWIRAFRAGDVFFDIGANIGSFALQAGAAHGDTIAVYAFEPAADTFASLVQNILLNELEHVVTALQVGLFDETGVQPFHYRKLGSGQGLNTIGEPMDYARRRFKPAAVQPVLTFRLDDLVERFRLPRPTRIKLDVEGAERQVLAGAVRTLTSGPCELWVELTETVEDDSVPKQLVAFLRGCGFELAQRVIHEHAAASAFPRVHDALFVRQHQS